VKHTGGENKARRRGVRSTRLRVSVSKNNRTEKKKNPVTSGSSRVAEFPRLQLITLLTDFGTSDYFVGAMKGVILSISPPSRIVDLTHDIPAQDIAAAAFTLLAAYRSFPAGTIHVAVVDPGVGSSRRSLLAVAGGRFFVGPDNGIFSYVLEREQDVRVFHLTREKYFRHPVSATFHGRDIFSPVAAALSNGAEPAELGNEIFDPVSLPVLVPESLGQGRQRGRILQIDHFGNCITNFTQQDVPAEWLNRGIRVTVNRKVIKSVRQYFSDEGGTGEELFMTWGSAGFLELAAMNRSAAVILRATRGQSVLLSTSGRQKASRSLP
jgi:S-adenosylmethionine hydrolase